MTPWPLPLACVPTGLRLITSCRNLWQLIMGFRVTQFIHVPAKLSVADGLRRDLEASTNWPNKSARIRMRCIACLSVAETPCQYRPRPLPLSRNRGMTSPPLGTTARAFLFLRLGLATDLSGTLHACGGGTRARTEAL
jgi:hypothetical protein